MGVQKTHIKNYGVHDRKWKCNIGEGGRISKYPKQHL